MPTITVSIPVDGTVVPQKAEKVGGKRIGFYYIILKSLKESRKNDVVKCLYIKGLTKFGYCVIKEGSAGDSKDNDGRDIQDRLKWQRDLHGRLGKSLRLPKLLGEFEENGNYYLVIEHLKGKPLHELVKGNRKLRQSLLDGTEEGKKVMCYLRDSVGILGQLHSLGIVHRDATLNNFMVTAGGKVAVIDMELSYSLNDHFPSPPFALGTHGYMSPEQEAMALPTVKEDIFAAGAMILYAWSGISPLKFVNAPYKWLEDAVRYFVPVADIARLILQCMHPDPALRPDALQLHASLDAHIRSRRNRVVISRQANWSPEAVHDALQSGLQAMGSPMFADPDKGWFAEHMVDPPDHSNLIRKGWYASFNRGVSGVLYFAGRAYAAGLDLTPIARPVELALQLIRVKYVENLERSNTGFQFGSDGVAYALAETVRRGWLNGSSAMQAHWGNMLARKDDAINLADGWAGQGIARYACQGFTDNVPPQELADLLLDLQLEDGSWLYKRKRPRFYFLEGMAGIIYFLLCHAQASGSREAMIGAERGLGFMAAARKKGTGVPVTWKPKGEHLSDHSWCDGNPGMALAWLKAWELTGTPMYRAVAEQLLEQHDISQHWRNLSLKSGIVGVGETYLEAAVVLGDERYLAMARQVSEVLLHAMRPGKHGPYWLVDNDKQPVTGLMIGNTGLLHFLLRSLYPGKFGFPGLL